LLKRNLEDATNLAPRSPLNCEPNKKRAHVSPCKIFGFLSTSNKFKKDDAIHVGFLENVMLFVIKGLMFMKIVELILLQKLTYMLCPRFVFPPRKTFVEEDLSNLVEKTMTIYVQPELVDCLLTTYTFDLWMSKGA
jgi:hypothetical protein